MKSFFRNCAFVFTAMLMVSTVMAQPLDYSSLLIGSDRSIAFTRQSVRSSGDEKNSSGAEHATCAFITFTLNHPQPVQLFVYDDAGIEVRNLIDYVLFDSGKHQLFMEGIGLEPGRYLYELRTRSETIRRTVDITPRHHGMEYTEPARIFINFDLPDFTLAPGK
jgi:hypothetical protein